MDAQSDIHSDIVALERAAALPLAESTPAEPRTLDRILETPAVQWYLQMLAKHPISTKQWTSCSGFVLGDILAQTLTEPHFTLSRTLILGIYGWLIDAPCGHTFYVRLPCPWPPVTSP